jgi:hypothetical protein
VSPFSFHFRSHWYLHSRIQSPVVIVKQSGTKFGFIKMAKEGQNNGRGTGITRLSSSRMEPGEITGSIRTLLGVPAPLLF